MTLVERAKALGLVGLVAHWDEWSEKTWVEKLIVSEEVERRSRTFQRRYSTAMLGAFKPANLFDWAWPKRIDRTLTEEVLTAKPVTDGVDIVFRGPVGTGKTMLAKNVAYQALCNGASARYMITSTLLSKLGQARDGMVLEQAFKFYTRFSVLILDEIAYASSYDARSADLLFELVRRRHEARRSLIVVTNKSFSEWGSLFPNTSCVLPIIDRLMNRCEVISIEGESYRMRENRERSGAKSRE